MIKKSNIKKKSIAEAAAASTIDWVAAPEITTNADAQDEADRQNTACLAAIGINEAITAEITVIVGGGPTPQTPSSGQQTDRISERSNNTLSTSCSAQSPTEPNDRLTHKSGR